MYILFMLKITKTKKVTPEGVTKKIKIPMKEKEVQTKYNKNHQSFIFLNALGSPIPALSLTIFLILASASPFSLKK